MRTTITIDDALYEEAASLCGDSSPSGVMTRACKIMVEMEAAQRLIKLAGKAPDFDIAPRSQRTGVLQQGVENNEPYNT